MKVGVVDSFKIDEPVLRVSLRRLMMLLLVLLGLRSCDLFGLFGCELGLQGLGSRLVDLLVSAPAARSLGIGGRGLWRQHGLGDGGGGGLQINHVDVHQACIVAAWLHDGRD